MSRLTYIVGDATEPQGPPGPKIIAHCVSNNGRSYGKGFALQLAKKWPKAKADYKAAFSGGLLIPGFTIPTQVEPDLMIVAIVGQHGLGSTSLRPRWLMAGLCDVATAAIEHNDSVHMPRIGCGLAGGNWDELSKWIEGIFNSPLATLIPVFVYDLPKSP